MESGSDTSLSTEASMLDCIDACRLCHETCLQTALTHCLQQGGKHVEPEHFRLMINCAELCQTSVNFMLGQSPLHAVVCNACAQVCRACAESCDEVGDMDECARVCRDCAAHCEKMGGEAVIASHAGVSSRVEMGLRN
jgi:hypothetical protein